ncbi:MAG: apolipoprotein N-acyltransferase [Thiobacillaceae bacterium]
MLALAASFAAGILAVGGFAPFNLYPLSMLGLALLFWQWHFTTTVRTGFLTGLAFGLGFFGSGVSWIFISLHIYGGMTAWLAGLATALFCSFLALFIACVGALFVFLRQRDTALLWLAPALWVFQEGARGWILTGFPWLALGYSQTPNSPLAGFAPLFGVYGVSYFSALLASLLVWSLSHRRMRAPMLWGLCGSALLLVSGWGLYMQSWTIPASRVSSVALVQGNIAQEMKWHPEKTAETLALYARLATAHPAQLIIFPETALPIFESDIPVAYREKLIQIGQQNSGDIVAGLPTGSPSGAYYNSVLSFGSAPTQAYHKFHLVPFGEYIPLKFLLGWVIEVLHIPLSDFSRGSATPSPLQVGGQLVAMNICYEDVFGEEIIRQLPEATVLANVSNDAWFGDSLALWQHAQISQMRALESGRMMLRATNTGLTAIINHKGELLAYLPPFTRGVLQGTVTGYAGSTPYVRWGNAPVWLVCGLMLGIAFLKKRTRWTNRR